MWWWDFCIWRRNHAPRSRQLAAQPRFDYYCWDLYARVSQWYEQDKQNLQTRLQTLHAIEAGGNETAAIADLISVAVLRRHLETMDRLDIEYDFLPRESEILHLHFWDAAFAKLKDAGVLFYETEGKNKGCWVMRRAGTAKNLETADSTENLESQSDEVSEEDQKVIVRSNGTVGYVGKDIAYHMWKFGLLGRDFEYRKFYRYPNQHQVLDFGDRGRDPIIRTSATWPKSITSSMRASRKRRTQSSRRCAGLGHNEAADHYTHFSYEMVALTPRCAAELGYQLSEEDKARSLHRSLRPQRLRREGRRSARSTDRIGQEGGRPAPSRIAGDDERRGIATQIAIGALRYFMLKFTKPSVIAFDFKEALSFEGETGPYAQYAVVRATNIFRKGGFDPDAFSRDTRISFCRKFREVLRKEQKAPKSGNSG